MFLKRLMAMLFACAVPMYVADAGDDLIGGDPAPAKDDPKPKADKKAAPAKAKAKPKAAPAKAKAAPAKPAKAKGAKAKSNGASGARGTRGEGKFYFPVGSPEREKLKKTLVAKLKGPGTSKQIAEKLSVPTWQVRLVAKEAAGEKLLKVKKDGGTLTISPK